MVTGRGCRPGSLSVGPSPGGSEGVLDAPAQCRPAAPQRAPLPRGGRSPEAVPLKHRVHKGCWVGWSCCSQLLRASLRQLTGAICGRRRLTVECVALDNSRLSWCAPCDVLLGLGFGAALCSIVQHCAAPHPHAPAHCARAERGGRSEVAAAAVRGWNQPSLLGLRGCDTSLAGCLLALTLLPE